MGNNVYTDLKRTLHIITFIELLKNEPLNVSLAHWLPVIYFFAFLFFTISICVSPSSFLPLSQQ